jgi:hypothetical protein
VPCISVSRGQRATADFSSVESAVLSAKTNW